MNIEEAKKIIKEMKKESLNACMNACTGAMSEIWRNEAKAIETVLSELEKKDKEIAYWKEQTEGYSGLAKQIQEEYENRIDEFVNRDRFE